MFFIMSVTDGRKDFDFCQTITCKICGKFGRYQVYMTYMVFSLFFIPCFKWNRHYYVQTTCCSTIYELDPQLGRRIASGEDVEITEDDLTMLHNGGWRYYGNNDDRGNYGGDGRRYCDNCGYGTSEDFEYCPKCGKPMK